jgi:hypothetical protein
MKFFFVALALLCLTPFAGADEDPCAEICPPNTKCTYDPNTNECDTVCMEGFVEQVKKTKKKKKKNLKMRCHVNN